ncbi:MAG: protein tyrosine phosphatase [Pseudomonadota bacterium]|nr:protein tyrosine phosphatase [Pseudomonadota bacterium]
MKFNLKTLWGRAVAWLYAMLIEHNFTNVVRFNFHRISEEAFRSSQPTMWQMRRMVKKHGIKTILNLKGANPKSAYWAFEREQCEKLGIQLVDVKIASRSIPNGERIRRAKEVFESIEYPVWMHCKAGADRAGIYSTLYLYFRKNIPIEETDQLRLWPFGHIRHSRAGKIDYFLQQFVAYRKDHPDVGLLEWTQHIADHAKLDREFEPGGLASFINDYVLRRE